MTIRYLCPTCSCIIEIEPVAELQRSKAKVIYVCKCTLCDSPADVTVSMDEILAKAEERLFDRYGHSYN